MKLRIFILLLFTNVLFAQKVTTSIDTTRNKIGAEFKLTLKTSVNKTDKVQFPKDKNFGALEVINSYKIDTIKSSNSYELIKKYGLTQFDSGKYTIPRLRILINGQPNYSDSIKVEVANVVVDTLKQKMYDIKDIEKEASRSNWWIYVLVIIVLIILGFLVYRLIKKHQNKPKQEEVIYKSPIEKATSLLQLLEKKELWQNGEVKIYYSELTDIVRNYIEEEIQIPAMESTTSELIISLKKVASQKKMKLSPEILKNLEKVLKQADLVKFAKVKPLDFEIEEDKKRISNSIITIHKSIPVVAEVNDELENWNEEQKQKSIAKKLLDRKIKRIKTAVIIAISVFFIGILATIFYKGFDFVRDFVVGNSTKDLVDAEWIYSEYGNPGNKIETPKVLKRIDAEKTLPKNAMALIKEMQIFSYGSLMSNFSVTVATKKLKQLVEINLDQLAEETTKIMESQGAQNIIFKQEDFQTNQGIAGKKAFGTLTMLDKIQKKSQKLYYEMLFFKQDGGIQQITVTYKEDDKYGAEISGRILNSVELKNATE
ncbi:MAG: hypothetical protein H7239_15290 [Flavobacterium sp.]|nr:hypothetical protein [Flavobacterium sp.]